MKYLVMLIIHLFYLQYSSKHHNCAKCNSRAQQQQQQSATLASGSGGSCSFRDCPSYHSSSAATKASTSSKSSSHSCCQTAEAPSSMTSQSNGCTCRYRRDDGQGEREREHTCQKCTVELANMKTRSKMDQLRLVMQQHKQKREARKLKSGPYATAASASAADSLSSIAAGGTAAVPMGAAAQYSAVSALVATPLQPAAVPVQTGKAAPANSITGNSSNANVNGNTSTAPATAATSAAAAPTAAPPSEVSPNHIVEEVDTAA